MACTIVAWLSTAQHGQHNSALWNGRHPHSICRLWLLRTLLNLVDMALERRVNFVCSFYETRFIFTLLMMKVSAPLHYYYPYSYSLLLYILHLITALPPLTPYSCSSYSTSLLMILGKLPRTMAYFTRFGILIVECSTFNHKSWVKVPTVDFINVLISYTRDLRGMVKYTSDISRLKVIACINLGYI